MPKIFTKNDSGFVCKVCGKDVKPLGYSSRNHCPYCLSSLHVDVNPGDRACMCGAVMYPIAVNPHAKHGYIITHKCSACGKIGNNKCAEDDDMALLIKYTNPYNIPEYKKGEKNAKSN